MLSQDKQDGEACLSLRMVLRESFDRTSCTWIGMLKKCNTFHMIPAVHIRPCDRKIPK